MKKILIADDNIQNLYMLAAALELREKNRQLQDFICIDSYYMSSPLVNIRGLVSEAEGFRVEISDLLKDGRKDRLFPCKAGGRAGQLRRSRWTTR